MNRTLKWHLWGAVLVILVGGLFHFVYELSGGFRPLALIVAVNESVWEHLKLGFWPAFLYSLVEYGYMRNSGKNFCIAIAARLYIIPVSIIVLFYIYTIFVEDFLLADILIFVFSVVLGFFASYRIMRWKEVPRMRLAGIAAIVIAFAAFSMLTYFAPHLPLFRDPVSGGYGIIN